MGGELNQEKIQLQQFFEDQKQLLESNKNQIESYKNQILHIFGEMEMKLKNYKENFEGTLNQVKD